LDGAHYGGVRLSGGGVSVGNVIGAVIGATIGFFVGGIPGAIKGAAIGSAIGGAALPPDLPTTYGPRLSDLKVQSSEYGAALPIVYGTAALQGTVIWSLDIKEVKTETETGGGLSEPEQTSVSYAYFGTFAVAVADGPIKGFLRIWAGQEKRLIYDGANLEGGGQVRFYLGDETQMPDPIIQADKGEAATAYRGTAYAVFEDFPLEKDGNSLPYLTFEITTGTADTCPVPVSNVVIDGQSYAVYDPAPVKIATSPEASQVSRFFSDATTGFIYYAYRSNSSGWFFTRVNPDTGEVGPPIGLGDSEPRIAWNNQGQAAIADFAGIYVTRVDLQSWQFVKEKAIPGIICAGTTCADIDIPLADVVWSDRDQEFKFLAYSNTTNGVDVGVFAIENTETVVSRKAGRPMAVNWGSVGVRFDGALLPMAGGDAAAGFLSQPSNYATEPQVFWSAYDSKRHVLVDFSSGVYSDLDGAGYVNTSAFGDYGTGQNRIVYSPYVDMYFVLDVLSIRIYDPEKLTPETWVPEECILFNGTVKQVYSNNEPIGPFTYLMSVFLLPGQPDWLGVFSGTEIFKVYIGKQGRVKGSGAVLADVVADLSKRAGETRYDVSQLGTDIVDGYIVARQMQVRGAIDVLRAAYYFDAVESQGIIKFVKRGGQAVAVIPDEDLAAHEPGSEAPDPLATARKMEVELPRAYNVKYMLAATDYSAAMKQARRLIGASGDEKTLEVPLVLTDAKAKEIAEVNLHAEWGERLSYQFSLPRKYSYLEPTDLIIVKNHLMRLTTVKATPRGILQCEAVSDESAYYAPHVVVTETPGTGGVVAQPGVTLLELF
jgi:hypothetical protein